MGILKEHESMDVWEDRKKELREKYRRENKAKDGDEDEDAEIKAEGKGVENNNQKMNRSEEEASKELHKQNEQKVDHLVLVSHGKEPTSEERQPLTTVHEETILEDTAPVCENVEEQDLLDEFQMAELELLCEEIEKKGADDEKAGSGTGASASNVAVVQASGGSGPSSSSAAVSSSIKSRLQAPSVFARGGSAPAVLATSSSKLSCRPSALPGAESAARAQKIKP
ncbi:unnamed protein product [Amoebophrya sp. A120]|nr:unnamed protein product [Amoebophrya sp. A120]CAD7976034.1 unnamed protein product [Amoebophrya sp. A120]|eukprot:GSA120T00026293001.1